MLASEWLRTYANTGSDVSNLRLDVQCTAALDGPFLPGRLICMHAACLRNHARTSRVSLGPSEAQKNRTCVESRVHNIIVLMYRCRWMIEAQTT